MVIRSFSIAEKAIFYTLVGIFAMSGLLLLWNVSQAFTVLLPANGGTLTEGVVGSPRFVNPLLAISEADNDLVALTYAGLLKKNSDGSLSPDLASSYTISPDGLTYTFILRNNLNFSDGKPLTADDVVFTINRAEDTTLKGSVESAWSGVKAIKIDPSTVQVTLSQAYAPFIYNFTLGILPEHIWHNVSDDSFPWSGYSVKPIGAGPYIVTKIVTDSSGLPIEYDLTANSHYALGTPHISNIVLKFYQNQSDAIDAYNSGTLDALGGISPASISSVTRTGGNIETPTLNRVFGVFWNQSENPVLLNKEVRVALDQAIDKPALVKEVLNGYAVSLAGPLLNILASTTPNLSLHASTTTTDAYIAAARATLEKAGWSRGSDGIYQKTDKKSKSSQTLSFSITTSDVPELKAAAEILQQRWQALGAQVSVKIFGSGDLNQNIIRPRQYDGLLFGEIIPDGNDLFPFWHSSERNDPGLNVAMYENINADKLLQKIRVTQSATTSAAYLSQFEGMVINDEPAVFLYAPDYIYIVPKNIHGMVFGTMSDPSERFDSVNEWYIETTHVWKIFQ